MDIISLWLTENQRKFEIVNGEAYIKRDDLLDFMDWYRKSGRINSIDQHKRFKMMREAIASFGSTEKNNP